MQTTFKIDYITLSYISSVSTNTSKFSKVHIVLCVLISDFVTYCNDQEHISLPWQLNDPTEEVLNRPIEAG
jgi:hypothetical protein